ncbi:MAG TPA: DUF4266 domain-containing protein [Bacteroidota bacterium]|nr:DUF4266 domain-containing protein [Bacteroidota bacterium]
MRTWAIRAAAGAVLAALAAGLGGCMAVKATERNYLADPIMEREDHFSKQTLAQKFFSSREGSIGGASGIGGGCGCAK